MKGFPYSTYPYGWFQLGWSDEFVAGHVVPMQCFGRELVAYRGDSGELHVLDAYCPHMGAHLGYGGKVDGEDVECPFHGWPTGRPRARTCRSLAPSVRTVPASSAAWAATERAGVVLVWYSPQATRPSTTGRCFVDPRSSTCRSGLRRRRRGSWRSSHTSSPRTVSTAPTSRSSTGRRRHPRSSPRPLRGCTSACSRRSSSAAARRRPG